MDTVIDRAFAAALYTEGDTGLDSGASLLAAAPEAAPELALRGEEFLRRAWQRGWQPADVVRLVRRDLAEQHVRLLAALTVSELRTYDTLPPRWRSQLDELWQHARRVAHEGLRPGDGRNRRSLRGRGGRLVAVRVRRPDGNRIRHRPAGSWLRPPDPERRAGVMSEEPETFL